MTWLATILANEHRRLEKGPWAAAEEFCKGASRSHDLRCDTDECDRSCCFVEPFVLSGEAPVIAARLLQDDMEATRSRLLAFQARPGTTDRCPLQSPETGLCEVYDVRPFLCRVYLVTKSGGSCGSVNAGIVDITKIVSILQRASYAGPLHEALIVILSRYGHQGLSTKRLAAKYERIGRMKPSKKRRRKRR